MSQNNQPNKLDTAQTYFYELARNHMAPPPPELDPQTAELIRQMVIAEQKAQASQFQIEAAKQRVWQRIQRPKTVSHQSPTVNAEIHFDSTMDDSPTINLNKKLLRWSRIMVVAGMAATILLMVGIIVLVIISTKPNQQTNLGGTFMPGAGGTTVTPNVTDQPGTVHNYKIVLQPTTPKFELAQLKQAAAILQQRFTTLNLSAQATIANDTKSIVVEANKITDQNQLIDTITSNGKVEVILVNGEQLTTGQAVQTTFCNPDKTAQSKTGQCLAGPQKGVVTPLSGQLNLAGQPFQTLFPSDQNDIPSVLQVNEVPMMIKVFNSLREKYVKANTDSTIAIVLDGKIFLTSVQFNQVLANPDQNQAKLRFLLAMLKSGVLPTGLQVTSSQQL